MTYFLYVWMTLGFTYLLYTFGLIKKAGRIDEVQASAVQLILVMIVYGLFWPFIMIHVNRKG